LFVFSLVCFSPLLAGRFLDFQNDAKQIKTILWPNRDISDGHNYENCCLLLGHGQHICMYG
jgi:hypothetical protein